MPEPVTIGEVHRAVQNLGSIVANQGTRVERLESGLSGVSTTVAVQQETMGNMKEDLDSINSSMKWLVRLVFALLIVGLMQVYKQSST